jgi:thiol-disulfide isomerase/thioredoxin
VGDPAPPLPETQWLLGKPATEFKTGRVYVLDLWATWCPPCIAAFTHLSQLQREYGDAVTVVGASIWEPLPDRVASFVEERADSIAFSVCTDVVPAGLEANHGLISQAWFYGSGNEGIPCLFIIDREARVAWIGSHTDVEGPLAQVVAGTWDRGKEAGAYALRMTDAAPAIRARWRIDEAVTAEDWNAAVREIDALLDLDPEANAWNAGMSLNIVAASLAAAEEGDRDLDLALRCAARSVDLCGEDPDLLATLARVHSLRGERDEAVAVQARAVALSDEDSRETYQAVLDEYKAARP